MTVNLKVEKPTTWFHIVIEHVEAEGAGVSVFDNTVIDLTEEDARDLYYTLKSHFEPSNYIQFYPNAIKTTTTSINSEDIAKKVADTVNQYVDRPGVAWPA